uniref:Predicted protein n=1 Tax=Hordeum vulgare subsp. vulgare TaxID=112509 RepID=F2E3W1_HORVV|nr:predicted protein [Hordeum vulgare subsp. vulgare]
MVVEMEMEMEMDGGRHGQVQVQVQAAAQCCVWRRGQISSLPILSSPLFFSFLFFSFSHLLVFSKSDANKSWDPVLINK